MQFKTSLGLVDIPNDEVLAAADEILGEVRDAPKPYARECEGRPGDRFEKGFAHVTVTAHCDGKVFYKALRKGDAIEVDCESGIEEWHRRVAKTMDGGATFTPAA